MTGGSSGAASGALEVLPDLVIPARCLRVSFARARGPGGQNVNKVETCVTLRFDLAGCDVLSEAQRARVAVAAGRRLTTAGVVVLRCDSHRERERNRIEARARLRRLVASALAPRKARKKTRPTRASRERRLAEKRRRSERKRDRGARPD